MSFLTAEWRDLAMVNWEVAPELLEPLVPRGTALDDWQGRTYLSLVAFRFLNTRVLRIPLPFHVNFEEVNLRFYVRQDCGGESRRGVVFIKEFVPRACIALVARRWYNENYLALPMAHDIERRSDHLTVRYSWTTRPRTHSVTLQTDGAFREIESDSVQEFITEHYWGYCRQRDGSTLEYRVEHPRWRVAEASDFTLAWDPVSLYGQSLGRALQGPPSSMFLADGSPVAVQLGTRLAD